MSLTSHGPVTRYVLFVGPGASGSSAMAAVPGWSRALGRPAELWPVDAGRGTSEAVYQAVFDQVRSDPDAAGAVVTGHKVAMFRAVAGRCRGLSADAQQLGELSLLAGRGGAVDGYATDVASVGAEVDRLWPYAGGTVACLGGGGAAAALCLHLARREARPARVVVCERDQQRARDVRALFSSLGDSRWPAIEVLAGRGPWDDVVARLPDGALVVNATGLGKADGRSPISPTAMFPDGATVWDLNYRGPLPVVAQARAQQRGRGLAVADGGRLFAVGWLAALGALFGIEATTPYLDTFLRIAEEARRP